MTIVGVDLGTTTGVARLVLDNPAGDSICAESIRLGSPSERSLLKKTRGPRALRDFDPRPKELAAALTRRFEMCPQPLKVYFEDVQFARGLAQAHLWASLRTALWLAPHVDAFVAVPVQTLKSFARAGGQAKDDMKAALARLLPSAPLENADDNQTDAIWLVLYGLANESSNAKP